MRRFTSLLACALLGLGTLGAAADVQFPPDATLDQCPAISNGDCKAGGSKCWYGSWPGRCSRPTGITQCTCVKATQ